MDARSKSFFDPPIQGSGAILCVGCVEDISHSLQDEQNRCLQLRETSNCEKSKTYRRQATAIVEGLLVAWARFLLDRYLL